MTLGIRRVIIYLLDIMVAVLSFFLGLRILLELFTANSSTPIVAWIYTVSRGLMSPFTGILPNLSLSNGSLLDIVAIVALLVYLLVIYVVMSLVNGLFARTTYYSDYRDRVI